MLNMQQRKSLEFNKLHFSPDVLFNSVARISFFSLYGQNDLSCDKMLMNTVQLINSVYLISRASNSFFSLSNHHLQIQNANTYPKNG